VGIFKNLQAMQNRSFLREAIVLFTLILITLNVHGQKTREEIADKYKWNLTDIYKSDADWKKAKEALALRGQQQILKAGSFLQQR
jgi:hypothetical protein